MIFFKKFFLIFSIFIGFSYLCIAGYNAGYAAGVDSNYLKFFDEKNSDIVSLLDRAKIFFGQNSLFKAAHEFRGESWRVGDVFLFLIDELGVCYVFGNQKSMIWRDFSFYKDVAGASIIERFGDAYKKDVFASFMINNGVFHCKIEHVVKNGKKFILGSGFFPKDPMYNAVGLVKRAKDLINKVGIDRSVSLINNPFGNFVQAGSYVDILDSDGIIVAHGGEVSRVGQSVYDNKESLPTAITRFRDEIYNKFSKEKRRKAVYIKNIKGVKQVLYIEKYFEKEKKKDFFIASISYPDINGDDVVTIVKEARQFLRRKLLEEGKREEAYRVLTEKKEGFRYGNVMVSVYNTNGLCLANASNPGLVGYNRLNFTDEFGRNHLKDIFDGLEESGNGFVWVVASSEKGNELFYAEKLDVLDLSLVVVSSFWPPVAHVTEAMTERASELFRQKSFAQVLNLLEKGDSRFFRGDLYPVIYNSAGATLFNRFNEQVYWTSLSDQNEKDREIIKKLTESATEDGVWVEYEKFGRNYGAFAKAVTARDTKDKLIVSTEYQYLRRR